MFLLLMTVVFGLATAPADASEMGNLALSMTVREFILIQSHPSLEPTDELTIEGWIKPLETRTTGRIFHKRDGGEGNGYSMLWNYRLDGSASAELRCDRLYVAKDPAPNEIYLGKWHHFAMTARVGGNLVFYIDGRRVSQATAPSCFQHSGQLFFSATSALGEEGFAGTLDEFRFWNVERSGEEIARDRFKVLENAPGLVSVWHFDGNARDSVGQNHPSQSRGKYVASEAPLTFSVEPDQADWRGGEFVELSGYFSGLKKPPIVLFGSTASPSVSVLDDRTVRAQVPPASKPGLVVSVAVKVPGLDAINADSFTYTPQISASEELTPGAWMRVDFRMSPPATVVVFLGHRGVPPVTYGGYDWKLGLDPIGPLFCHQFIRERAGSFEVPIPDDDRLVGQEFALQGLVGDFDGVNASFTNCIDVKIR
ncbi:MAG: LamG-like jellyroll fold domain-containing protein [Planctomycetota bacterium]